MSVTLSRELLFYHSTDQFERDLIDNEALAVELVTFLRDCVPGYVSQSDLFLPEGRPAILSIRANDSNEMRIEAVVTLLVRGSVFLLTNLQVREVFSRPFRRESMYLQLAELLLPALRETERREDETTSLQLVLPTYLPLELLEQLASAGFRVVDEFFDQGPAGSAGRTVWQAFVPAQKNIVPLTTRRGATQP